MGEHGLYLFIGTIYGTFIIMGLIEEYARRSLRDEGFRLLAIMEEILDWLRKAVKSN